MSDLYPPGERFTVHLDDLQLSGDGTWIYAKGQPGHLGLGVGRTIVANGCFDGMLHPGHLSLFSWLDTHAYRLRLRPVVAINSDKSVGLLKGPGRPVWPQEVRAFLINHLKWPLTVIVFDEETPQRLMDLLRPAAVLKGDQYAKESVVRWKDSEVITVPMKDQWSTSRILGDTR
jgi:D-beta-D-heptose 7-phosphate kinase/D-beta-D-heptose 1-phosphate adenosyltransferase